MIFPFKPQFPRVYTSCILLPNSTPKIPRHLEHCAASFQIYDAWVKKSTEELADFQVLKSG
jgi:hypothetical protein